MSVFITKSKVHFFVQFLMLTQGKMCHITVQVKARHEQMLGFLQCERHVSDGRGHVNSDLNSVPLSALPGCQFSLLPSGLLESV